MRIQYRKPLVCPSSSSIRYVLKRTSVEYSALMTDYAFCGFNQKVEACDVYNTIINRIDVFTVECIKTLNHFILCVFRVCCSNITNIA